MEVSATEIRQGFGFQIGLEELLLFGRKECGRENVSPACEDAVRRALSAGRSALACKAYMKDHPLKGWTETGDCAILESDSGGEELLSLGPEAKLLFGASILVPALCTVGSGIEEVAEREESELVRYYLNVFGVKALESVRHAVQGEIAARARSRGWGVSPSLSPGSLQGWPLEGQRDIFRLTGGEKTGMRINEAALLIPAMSMSFLVGMGPGLASQCVPSLCAECPRYGSCAWRQQDGM